MKNFYVLTDALEYIEKNICEDFGSQSVADYCGVSLSSLQKLFRLALHRSVRDYIQRRRICLAAKDILHSGMRMIDIAYKYQFGSPESFTRAFKKVWTGDIAIAESLKRIDRAAGDDMIPLRIGGDEFALITGSTDYSCVEKLVQEILSDNGEPIPWKKQEVPLSLRAGVMQIPQGNLKYDEFFVGMHKVIEEKRAEELEDAH